MHQETQKKTYEYIRAVSLEHKKLYDKEKKTKAYKEREKEINKHATESFFRVNGLFSSKNGTIVVSTQ